MKPYFPLLELTPDHLFGAGVVEFEIDARHDGLHGGPGDLRIRVGQPLTLGILYRLAVIVSCARSNVFNRSASAYAARSSG